MAEFTRQLVEPLARDAGFSAAAIVAVPAPGSAEDREERARFTAWVDEGRAGEMEYLQRRDDAGALLRSSVRVALPWARSVIVCAANYNAAQPRSTDPAPQDAGWIARYAWSSKAATAQDGSVEARPSDYHKVLKRRLESLRERLVDAVGSFESRCFVDTGPVVERVYARYAGIGWTGKNTCILSEKLGSWIFLGVIVTSLEFSAQTDATSVPALLAPDRCGSCTRCIDACPTQALTGPRQMDATRCISYLTIEKRGSIPEELRSLMGRQVFGCDICQDVCPWNRRAPIAADPELAPRPALVNPALAGLAEMDEATWESWFNGSPVRRAQYSGFRRNLAIAMGNSGQQEFRATLRAWAEEADPVLAESARWALAELDQEQKQTQTLAG
ncbi:MAG: tRNA epoxyqueuosine(34) reductase QueG [Acidobacteriaceae bacterium]